MGVFGEDFAIRVYVNVCIRGVEKACRARMDDRGEARDKTGVMRW